MGTVQVQAVRDRLGRTRALDDTGMHRCAICGTAQDGEEFWIVLSSRQAGYLNGVPADFRTVCRECARPRMAAQTP